MASSSIPPLPPGFKLEPQQSSGGGGRGGGNIPPLPPGFKLEQAKGEGSGGSVISDALGGIGAGVFSTIKGASELTRANKLLPAAANKYLGELSQPPDSTAGRVGKSVEQMGEYFIPGIGEEEMAGKGLALIAKTAARSAAKAGAVGAVQGGSLKAGVGPAASAGITTGTMSALTPAIANLGRKIQMSTIRPRAVDVRDGFKMTTVDKLSLKGNLEQSLKQVDTKLDELRNARNAMITPGSSNVDLHTVFTDALNDVSRQAKDLKFGGMGSKAQEQVENMRKDVESLLNGNLNVDISKAENLKEFLGTLGSWSYGKGDPDAKVTELVANSLYTKVKTAIEQSLGTQGPKVRALNKQMQDIIPVKFAMLARLPVEERNRMFSLADIAAMMPAVVTGDVSLLGLEGLTRAQKSLRFGNFLSRTAQSSGTGGARAAGRITGGVSGQNQ